MEKYFEFEKSIEDIDSKVERLENKNHDNDLDLINKYKQEKKNLFKNIYNSLTSWQKVQVARHANRPHTINYINNIFSKFIVGKGLHFNTIPCVTLSFPNNFDISLFVKILILPILS
mgnify:CR=1 FL=1